MSKVSITIELDQTLCHELDEMRDAVKTLDFSSILASIERVQKHGNAMESALYRYKEVFEGFDKVFDENLRETWDGSKDWVLNTPEEKLAKLKEILDGRKIKQKLVDVILKDQ